MSEMQRFTIKIAVAAIVLMMVFPPFRYLHIGLGHGFIFDPPKVSGVSGTIDALALMAQFFGVLAVAGLVWWIQKGD